MRVFAFIAISTMRRSEYFTSVFELRPVGDSHDSSRCSWATSLARLNWSTDSLSVPSIDLCPTEGGRDSFLCGCAMVVHLCFHLDLLARLRGPRAPQSLRKPQHEQPTYTLVAFCCRHFFSLSFGSTAGDPRRYLRHWEKVLPCKKEHISTWNTEWQPLLGRAIKRFP